MRKHRRMRHPGSTMMGGLVAVALAGLIIGIVLALRSTGILDRRVVFGADSAKVVHDVAVAKSAAERDGQKLGDGTPLEYNSQMCTVPLAGAALPSGAAAAFVEGAKTRGRLTDQQVWSQLVAPHHGDTAAEPATAPWSTLAAEAVARATEAIADVNLMPSVLTAGPAGSDAASEGEQGARGGVVLLAGCGLGRLASAVAETSFASRVSLVACTEQGSEDQAVAEAHLQQVLSGRALLSTRVVLAPGPSAGPRLGLGASSVDLFLSPLEATFREVRPAESARGGRERPPREPVAPSWKALYPASRPRSLRPRVARNARAALRLTPHAPSRGPVPSVVPSPAASGRPCLPRIRGVLHAPPGRRRVL